MANEQQNQQGATLAVLSRQAHEDINKMEREFINALQGQIDVKFFIRTTLTAINSNPDLLQADRRSLLEAATKAAQDGLVPDGREGAFSIFNAKVKRNGREIYIKKVQWMPMVFGIIKKVRNSGEIKMLTARVVYGGDKFRYWVDDTGEHIEYEPADEQDLNIIRRVFAMAITKDGALQVEPMTVAQIEQVRASSKTPNSGPWRDWWDQMALKTAIRRLSKRLPMSAIDKVLSRDDNLYNIAETSGHSFVPLANPLKDDIDDVKGVTIDNDDTSTDDNPADSDETKNEPGGAGNQGPYDGEGTAYDESDVAAIDRASQAASNGNLHDLTKPGALSRAVNEAARVIDENGKMTKDSGQEKPQPILDQRFELQDAFFNTFDEWVEACTDSEMAVRFSPTTGLPIETKRKEAEQQQTTNQPAKSDTLFPDAEKLADAPKRDAAIQQPAETKTAPAAAPKPRSAPEDAPYANAGEYIAYMDSFFENVTSETKLNEEWASSRTNRNNMLSADQIETMTKKKADTLKRIRKAAEK